MRYYDSLDDIQRRLGNTIVLYKKVPIYVVQAASQRDKKLGLNYYDLPAGAASGELKGVCIDDPDLNYLRLRVGFINYKDTARRLIRVPMRGIIQGLHSETTRPLALENGRYMNESIYDLFREQQVCDTFCGKFPTIKEAKRRVESNEYSSCAFHWDWAWTRTLGHPVLVYKDNAIGLLLDESRPIKLEPKLRYLKEAVEELGLRTCN